MISSPTAADPTSTDPDGVRVRTYGGWRQSRDIGLWGLGPAASTAAVSAVLVPLLLASMSWRAAAACVPVSGLVVALLVVRVQGVPVGHMLLARARWWRAVRAGWTEHTGGVLVDHPGAWQLPGVLAPTRLVEAEDGRGGTFGLVWDRRTGLLTATLHVAASSTWLVDVGEADVWVGNWHRWLAQLGYVPAVAWVAVTVDTAPEPGTALHDQAEARLDPHAPADATRFVRELVAASPAAAAEVTTRVSITLDTSRAAEPLQQLSDHTSWAARALSGLEASLGQCGVAVLGRATAAELAGTVRAAFDPAAHGQVTRTLAGGDPDGLLDWGTAGPVAAGEEWGRYRHDSGWSVSWAWHEAPRQQVTSGVLARLLSPGRHRRRVTLLYRPAPAARAAAVLERQVNATAFRTALRDRQGIDATARDTADQQRARQAAVEEAAGAGVVDLSVYVSTTVLDPELLPAAVADVEDRAEQSQVRLRRLWGGQSVGFATTLPCGICPPAIQWKART